MLKGGIVLNHQTGELLLFPDITVEQWNALTPDALTALIQSCPTRIPVELPIDSKAAATLKTWEAGLEVGPGVLVYSLVGS